MTDRTPGPRARHGRTWAVAGWLAVAMVAPLVLLIGSAPGRPWLGISVAVLALLRARDHLVRPDVALTETELVVDDRQWPDRAAFADVRDVRVERRVTVVLVLDDREVEVGPLPPTEVGDLLGQPTPAHRLAAEVRRRAGLPAGRPPRRVWWRPTVALATAIAVAALFRL